MEQAAGRRTGAGGFEQPLLLSAKQDVVGYLGGWAGRSLLLAVACSSILAVVLILVFITREAWPFLAGGGLGQLLSSTQWHPEAAPAEFGALALVAGSAYVTVGAMIIAVPMGILAAVFLSDMVPFHARQLIKPVIELLAAVPSVAYGFFAILVLAPWMQRSMGLPSGANGLNASVILAIMAVPTIVSIAEDALTAAGRDLREGAYALGATRAETLLKVVMPAAHSGLFAAVILGMMRAIGETMVVWMASGNAAQIPAPWWDLTQSVRTLTATIAGDMGETAKGSDHYHALFALAFLLLVVTFGLNLISEYFLARAKRARTGGGR